MLLVAQSLRDAVLDAVRLPPVILGVDQPVSVGLRSQVRAVLALQLPALALPALVEVEPVRGGLGGSRGPAAQPPVDTVRRDNDSLTVLTLATERSHCAGKPVLSI